MNAFVYLARRSVRNWIHQQLLRLRRVRYLLGLFAGALYFWWFFFRHADAAAGEGLAPSVEVGALAALFLFVPFAVLWLIRANPQALAFSDAERQHLFPAPVTRRTLIFYKLARGQLPVLLNVMIFTFIVMREGSGVFVLQRAVAFWALFTTLYLHRLGAALTRLSGRTRVGSTVLNVAPAVVIGSVLTAIAFSVQQALPRITAAGEFDAMVRLVLQTLSTGAAGVVLAPFRALVAPVFTVDLLVWLPAMGLVLLILAAHILWVLRVNVAFEEAAATASVKVAGRAASLAEGRPEARSRFRLPRLPLDLRGRPEVAIVWKNTAPMLDALSPVLAIALVVLVGLGAQGIASRLPAAVTPGILVMVGALLGAAAATALGPFALRYDLRNDLPRLALLRTYPLPGERLVWAEVLSTAVPIAILQLLLLAVALIASMGEEVVPIGLADRVAIALALALLLPFVSLAGVMVQNAAALLYPDWVRIGTRQGGGLESLGQTMLLFGATLIVTLLLLVFPLAGAALASFAARLLGPWALVPAAGVAAGLLLFQIRPVMGWLGGVFERTDPVEAGVER